MEPGVWHFPKFSESTLVVDSGMKDDTLVTTKDGGKSLWILCRDDNDGEKSILKTCTSDGIGDIWKEERGEYSSRAISSQGVLYRN
jgi:hypothetical protein